MKGEVAYVVVKEKPVKLACLGYVYLTFTLCCSIGYLFLLIEVTKNDHWWREFNTTGAQTFLADVFNSKLHLGQYGSLNLFDVALPKDYSTGKTFVDIQPSVARRLLLDDLPLDVAIQTIRANSLFENIYTVIPYCWVDFDRMFEMAHTARRQERCYVNQRDNAAVYMEALLRNVNSNDLAQSSYGIQINQMILTPITMLPGGPPWISSLPNRTQISLEDEIAFWRQYGLTRYTIQYQNRFQYGLDSSITIVNAFGVTQTMKIHSSPYTDRGSAIWTTRVAFCGIWNDFSSCNGFHCSLVRSSNNSLEAQGRNWDVIYTGGGPSIGGDLMRVALGPYVNWDLHYIPAPPSLVEIFAAFQSHVCKIARLAATADVSPFSGIENADIDIVPPEWRYDGMVYYGANPPCAILATPQTYVQMPFRFDDTCHALSQFSIHINPTSLLFSVVLANVTLDQVPRICSCSLTLASTCATLLGRAIGAIPKIFPLPFTSTDAQTTILDIMGLNILFIQMAARNTTKVLLKQPVISNPPDKWTLFGWIALSDWIDGSREVYTFEGDNGNLTLMSARSPPLQMAASALELPQAACWYFWVIALYVSSLSVAVSIFLLVYGAWQRTKVDGCNLLVYNRIFGSVWVGRPFCFIRGMTAVVILSTSTATLTSANRMAWFVDYQRHWIIKLIVTGETLWLTYCTNDVLLPFTEGMAREYAPLHTILAFFTVFLLDVIAPIQVQAIVDPKCTITSFRSGAACSSGSVEIGSFHRVVLIVALHFACLLVAILTIWLCHRFTILPIRPPSNLHAQIPASMKTFCIPSRDSTWQLDNITCIMGGMLPFNSILFNFNIWTQVHTSKTLRNVTLNYHKTKAMPSFDKIHQVLGLFSLLYMVGAIASSYSFLVMTEDAMANDFWWAGFDKNTQGFLCNCFNQVLQLMSATTTLNLTDAQYGVLSTTTNSTLSAIQLAPFYATSIQDEVNSLRNVIQGLRRMDGCHLPWIMTTYCYVDFSRRWEMAKTPWKQQQCANESENAAVYLESLLRNADWDILMSCWGAALEVGVFSFLKGSNGGLQWLLTTKDSGNSISEEVAFWSKSGLTRFTTQWQNYKSLGIVESLNVKNAFGISYPLTIKYSNGSYQLSSETSRKMQWPLANDLLAILSNSSLIQGMNLIRSSSNFAFWNSTPEQILYSSGWLVSPLGPGLSLIRNVLGPFGSVSMKRIACPMALQELYKNITFALTRVLASDGNTQRAFWPIYSSFTIAPRPQAWDTKTFVGGNLLCDVLSPSSKIPGVAFTSAGSCGSSAQEPIVGDTSSLLGALLAVKSINSTTAAQRDVRSPESTLKLLLSSTSFLKSNLPQEDAALLLAQAQPVKAFVYDQLRIYMVQYTIGPPYGFARSRYFDPAESDFELYTWLILFDWVKGLREAVFFEGENGNLTAMSSSMNFNQMPINPMEVPRNVSLYVRRLLQYITLLMLYVACIVSVYIIKLKGQIEAYNMLVFSRVTGLVWVGRPMVIVRALSAICLLATASLSLVRPVEGLVSYFVSTRQPWYKIILTAGELHWLVYVVNDIFSILTDSFTPGYASSSFILVWVSSTMWAFLLPPSSQITLSRDCTIEQVDYQVVCTSGVVEIGQLTQMYGLTALVLSCCFLCYLFERFHSRRIERHSANSLLLYAAAKHQFKWGKWEYKGIWYIDKASAVLTGILTWETSSTLCVFDIKTWRIHTLSRDYQSEPNMPSHLKCSVPLVE